MVRKIEGFGKSQGFDVEGYRRRLRIMREIISGDNQTAFAKRLGLDFKRWSNYERGYPIPREVAFMLHDKFPGMSIEWIWFGSTASLAADYLHKIRLAEKFDLERDRDLAEVDRIQRKLDRTAARRKQALAKAFKG
jgi:hypothetical protein